MTALEVTIRKTINALIMRKETIAETENISLLIFIIHNMETSLFLHKLKDKYQHSEHFILIPDWHGLFPSKVCRLDSWSDYLMDFRTHTGNTSFASMCHNKKEQEELLTNIHRKVVNTNFLVYSLLKLSLLDTNTIEFKKEKINLRKMLDGIKDNLGVIGDLKNVRLDIVCDSTISIMGDEAWESEALTNIIKNGIEYSKENSKVSIIVQDNELFTKIMVKDYGLGMSDIDMKNVFKRFYKGINSSSNSFGIGLSLAKQIIEKDNGNVSVTSTLGVGTTFTIRYMKK